MNNSLWDSIAIIIESESSLTRIVNESSLPIVLSTFDILDYQRNEYILQFYILEIPDKTNAKTHVSIASIGFETFTSHDK
jgi:hypothetical protein